MQSGSLVMDQFVVFTKTRVMHVLIIGLRRFYKFKKCPGFSNILNNYQVTPTSRNSKTEQFHSTKLW